MNSFTRTITTDPSNFNATADFVAALINLGYKKEATILLDSFIENSVTMGLSENLESANQLKHLINIQNKVCSIHQPNYLPWLGYFHKIFYSDVFVIHDNIEFSKKTFIKRVFIKKPGSVLDKDYITVPLKKHSDHAIIKDLRVDNSKKWHVEHLNLIKASYSNAPYFKVFYGDIEKLLHSVFGVEDFTESLMIIIKGILKIIDCTTPIYLSSSLPVTGMKHQYNMNIVNHFNCNIYFSGLGAKIYQENVETPENIKIIYQNIFNFIEKHPYKKTGEFLNGLSIVDALFWIGVEGIIKLFNDYSNVFLNDELYV